MEGINIFYEFNGCKRNLFCENVENNQDLYNQISRKENLPLGLFKLFLNGKCLIQDQSLLFEKKNDLFLNVTLPLVGGKGGFGSMLRAIGAQIEKTTNKEACRDLSGRRLRDVNAEKRIKNWIKKKAEQQKELEIKRREKLERLIQEPKINFKDDEYLKEKDIIPQKVDQAIDYVLKNKKIDEKKVSSTVKLSENRKKTINETNQPCTSSSGSDNEVNLENLTNLSENNSNVQNNLPDSTSNNSLETEIKVQKFFKKRKQDEPVVVSKKKKVGLWLGDDLNSEEDSNEE